MANVGEFRHNLDQPLKPGRKVVIRTERGVELGEVLAEVTDDGGRPDGVAPDRLEQYIRDNGNDYPFRRGGRILREAGEQDIIDHRHLHSQAREQAAFCMEQARQLKLDMKVVTVEHLLGGERIVFYFSAENRVDFRELVKRLAGEYRTRIEMRQVGARDEARLVADYERCGQRCCCQQYLKHLQPVSMRMAKLQKATLDPTKISGRCGRLMCCLRYEDDGYRDLKSKLPRKNTYVRSESCVGRVVDGQVLTQLVKVQLSDGTFAVIPNEEIIERDMTQPPPAIEKPEPPKRRPRPERKPQQQDAEDKTEQDGSSSGPPKKKRRRRRKKKKGGSQASSGGGGDKAQGSTSGDGSAEGSADRPKKKRRRRRRKKKSSQGQGGGNGSSGSGSGGG
jgi:cell fate regulator YaaT (PSP1 superfamily)